MDDSLLVGDLQGLRRLYGDVKSFSGRTSILSFRLCPWMYSMTMNECPSASSISWMVQMLGWFRAAAAFASRIKRV